MRGSTTNGIVSNPFLDEHYRTEAFSITVTVIDDESWSYEQTTTLHVPGRDPFSHTDRSVLRLGPSSLLVLQPPRSAPATRSFLLEIGRLFFLHREEPSDVEFEIPSPDR